MVRRVVGPHAAVYPGPAITKWEQQKTTLFLVDPHGGRYLSRHASRSVAVPAVRLVGRRPARPDRDAHQWRRAKSRVEEIDLASGKILSQFTSSGSNTYDDVVPVHAAERASLCCGRRRVATG